MRERERERERDRDVDEKVSLLSPPPHEKPYLKANKLILTLSFVFFVVPFPIVKTTCTLQPLPSLFLLDQNYSVSKENDD